MSVKLIAVVSIEHVEKRGIMTESVSKLSALHHQEDHINSSTNPIAVEIAERN